MSVKQIKKTVVCLIISMFPFALLADIVVIANPGLPVTSLSKEEVKRIYLGKTKFLSTGVKITPVDQRPGSPVREKFYMDLVNKSDSEMKSYWSRIIFAGQGYPPIQESDDKSVLNAVASNGNYLGYIDKSYLTDAVKVIYTL